MLPAAVARTPAASSTCATSAVVVVLPFVPVIAMQRAPSSAAKPISISDTTGTRASRAAATGGASRATHAQDGEALHNLRLRPAELFEVVMQRRHPEHAMGVRVLLAASAPVPAIRARLQQHRYCLGREHAAGDQQQELRLEEDRHGA